MMKKFLSLLTVLALVMSLMPTAMAGDIVIDTVEELNAAIASDAEEIDIKTVTVSEGDVTIDLKGKTINASEELSLSPVAS